MCDEHTPQHHYCTMSTLPVKRVSTTSTRITPDRDAKRRHTTVSLRPEKHIDNVDSGESITDTASLTQSAHDNSNVGTPTPTTSTTSPTATDVNMQSVTPKHISNGINYDCDYSALIDNNNDDENDGEEDEDGDDDGDHDGGDDGDGEDVDDCDDDIDFVESNTNAHKPRTSPTTQQLEWMSSTRRRLSEETRRNNQGLPLTIQYPPDPTQQPLYKPPVVNDYYLQPCIIYWPEQNFPGFVVRCSHYGCSATVKLTPGFKTRRIADVQGTVWLCQTSYQCADGHPSFKATSSAVMASLPGSCLSAIPFKIARRSAISRQLFVLIEEHQARHILTRDLHELLYEYRRRLYAHRHLQYLLRCREYMTYGSKQHIKTNRQLTIAQSLSLQMHNEEEQFSVQPFSEINHDYNECAPPASTTLQLWFLTALQKQYKLHEQEIAVTYDTHIGIDHSHKVMMTVKAEADNNTTSRVFHSQFTVYGMTKGIILHYQFVKSNADIDSAPVLKELARRMPKNTSVVAVNTDRCCADRKLITEAFGKNVKINKDVFHWIALWKAELDTSTTEGVIQAKMFVSALHHVIYDDSANAKAARNGQAPLRTPEQIWTGLTTLLIAPEHQFAVCNRTREFAELQRKHIMRGCLSEPDEAHNNAEYKQSGVQPRRLYGSTSALEGAHRLMNRFFGVGQVHNRSLESAQLGMAQFVARYNHKQHYTYMRHDQLHIPTCDFYTTTKMKKVTKELSHLINPQQQNTNLSMIINNRTIPQISLGAIHRHVSQELSVAPPLVASLATMLPTMNEVSSTIALSMESKDLNDEMEQIFVNTAQMMNGDELKEATADDSPLLFQSSHPTSKAYAAKACMLLPHSDKWTADEIRLLKVIMDGKGLYCSSPSICGVLEAAQWADGPSKWRRLAQFYNYFVTTCNQNHLTANKTFGQHSITQIEQQWKEVIGNRINRATMNVMPSELSNSSLKKNHTISSKQQWTSAERLFFENWLDETFGSKEWRIRAAQGNQKLLSKSGQWKAFEKMWKAKYLLQLQSIQNTSAGMYLRTSNQLKGYWTTLVRKLQQQSGFASSMTASDAFSLSQSTTTTTTTNSHSVMDDDTLSVDETPPILSARSISERPQYVQQPASDRMKWTDEDKKEFAAMLPRYWNAKSRVFTYSALITEWNTDHPYRPINAKQAKAQKQAIMNSDKYNRGLRALRDYD